MAPERIVFPMKWSPVVRTVTAAVNCLFVAIPLLAMLLAPETWPLAAGIGGCVGIPVWLICRGYCPRVLEADERNLTIRRRMFGDVVIPVRYIRYVRVVSRAEVAYRSVRTGGSGGYYGYFGTFWSRRLKSFRLYATDLHGLVYIVTADRNYVIGCSDPKALVKRVGRILGTDVILSDI